MNFKTIISSVSELMEWKELYRDDVGLSLSFPSGPGIRMTVLQYMDELKTSYTQVQSAAYLIKNMRTDEFYIGSSGNIHDRLIHHRAMLYRGNHHVSLLQRSFNEISSKGLPTPFVAVIIFTLSKEESMEVEQMLLTAMASEVKCLNRSTSAYKNQGWEHSAESKAAMSLSHAGKTLSAQHRQNISRGNTGRVPSEETRKKISMKHQGKKISPEHLLKLRKGWEDNKEELNKRNKSSEHLEHLKRCNALTSKSVVIDSKNYGSMSEAARSLGISVATVSRRINDASDKYPSYQVCA